MNITVCIKLISQMQFTDFINTGSADRLKNGRLSLNPADEYALELALRIRDSLPDVYITVISMAPQYAEYYLRTALAMGADRAILASDAAFAGSDTLMTSYVLSRVIMTLPPQDVIVCGSKAMDSETGHIGAQLGARLGLRCASNILSYEADEDGALALVRAQDNGIVELKSDTPVVVTVCNSVGMVRNPSIRAMRKSAFIPVESMDRRALGILDPQAGRSFSGTETVAVEDMHFASREHRRTASGRGGADALLLYLKEGANHER